MKYFVVTDWDVLYTLLECIWVVSLILMLTVYLFIIIGLSIYVKESNIAEFNIKTLKYSNQIHTSNTLIIGGR